jgi:hypothetical protein
MIGLCPKQAKNGRPNVFDRRAPLCHLEEVGRLDAQRITLLCIMLRGLAVSVNSLAGDVLVKDVFDQMVELPARIDRAGLGTIDRVGGGELPAMPARGRRRGEANGSVHLLAADKAKLQHLQLWEGIEVSISRKERKFILYRDGANPNVVGWNRRAGLAQLTKQKGRKYGQPV